MVTARGVSLSILSFILIIFLSFVIVLASAGILLYPEVYQEAFEENNFYSSLENSLNESNGGAFILFESGLKPEIDSLLENFLAYLRGESEKPNLEVKINREGLRSFLEESVKSFPSCESGEKPFDENGDVICKPLEKTGSEFVDDVLEKKNLTFFESESVDLAEVYGLSNPEFQKARGYVILYNWILYSMIFFSLTAMVLIFFISEKSLLSSFKIYGISFLAAGISTIISVLISNPILNSVIDKQILLQPDFEILKNVILSIYSSIFGRMNLYGYFFTGAGAVVFAASWYLKKKTR